MIGKTISHYRVLEKLGEGGMGVVYKAEDIKLGRTVALKFLPPELTRSQDAKARFIHEAQAASALQHNNICTIHEIDETPEGQLFMSMDCYDGETLKQKISKGPLRVHDALNWTIQVAQGLLKAHASGMVHRDIKPGNIMVTSDGVAKILDFGLAKLAGQTRMTKTGKAVGTAAYMSPEQTKGDDVDARTDIWALGVSLYEMLAGELPFKGEYEPAVVYSILHESPTPLSAFRSDVPTALERLIQCSMSKNPDDRYQQMGDVLAELKDIAEGMERSGALSQDAGIRVRRKSIAVLPLKSLSDSKEDEYFSDGVTEDILTHLSKISGLRVISRQSVMQYKDSKKGLREIGGELGVAVALEGSVRRAGDRVRIVAQLIDARTDEHIWAETYDREMKDIFAIQSDVAQQIARALEIKLSPMEKERIEKKPTEDVTAYDYYVRGRDYYYRYRKQDNENAIGLFRHALELDPGFALAYAGLSDAHSQMVFRLWSVPSSFDLAVEAGEKAISLDPGCAEGYKALGLAYSSKGWLRKAAAMLQKATELNAGYFPAVANMCWVKLAMGELAEALVWAEKAVALAPTFAYCHVYGGSAHSSLLNFPQAELWLSKAKRLQPDLTGVFTVSIEICLMQHNYESASAVGREFRSSAGDEREAQSVAGDVAFFCRKYDEAEAYYKASLEMRPAASSETAFALAATRLAYIYLRTGREEYAKDIFKKSLERLQAQLDQGSEMHQVPYEISAINAVQGNNEESCRWLRKAIERGFRDYPLTLIDPLFENIRDDERFRQLMSEVKGIVDGMRKQAGLQ